MDVFEITGFHTGISREGVNYLQPVDSYTKIFNGFIYRQVLQSRRGAAIFGARLAGGTRVLGIFEHIKPDASTDLLVFDENFLYKYNTATDAFDQIPFGGSMAGYAGFSNTTKDFYISGVSYSAAPLLSSGAVNPTFGTNGERFIFTGEGVNANAAGSSIFFFNGTDVRDFTSVVDNPNFAQFTGGTLTKATFVTYFNQRLNFLIPVISGLAQEQSLLYSAIKTTNGNGDKFNIVTSGIFETDTVESIAGFSIVGEFLVVPFTRSSYAFEVTTDKFNPYFRRKVPSVLGCNAKFSPIAWNDQLNFVGKTGILITDGRKQLRKDNKIPQFASDEIDQVEFNLTYGGFDRATEQILWSYKSSESETTTQDSVLVKNYEEDNWSIYDQRFSVFGQSDLGINLTWDDIYEINDPAWATWDTTEDLWDRIGIGQSVQKTLAGDDLGFIYELNRDLDDYTSAISAVATGATTTLTVDPSAFLAGDLVTIEDVQGMVQLNNYDPSADNLNYTPWEIISATPTSIEINANSSLYDPYTLNTGRISKVITFEAETIPFNPYRSQGNAIIIFHVEFLMDINGGILKVDVFADEESAPFKQDIILFPDQNLAQARQWVSMSVNSEANFFTFKLKQKRPGSQLRITSMRIHAKKGIMTND